jgi:hypothetical protein
MRLLLATALSASLASWGAAAQQMPGASNSVPALQPGHQGAIEFVSGGASLDDRQTLQGMAGKYDMRLTFAALPGHEYLSGVGVTLADASGKTLLDTVSDGPLFYAQVPTGHYRITVTNGGQSQSGDIAIAGNGAVSRAFFWRRAG